MGKVLASYNEFCEMEGYDKKSKVTVSNFEELRSHYLMNIKAIVTLEEIPDDIILNWDQTAIKYIPLSNWTMENEGFKWVEIVGIDDK